MAKLRGANTPCPGPNWKESTFFVSLYGGTPTLVAGWEYKGVGFWLFNRSVAKYRRKNGTRRVYSYYSAVHLNSGHVARSFAENPNDQTVFDAVTDLAEMTDWTFEGLEGWRNMDPDIPDKLQAWHARHKLKAYGGAGHRSQEAAAAISSARAG